MSEFEDKIGSILSDPGQMEKISRLAAQFMGGGPEDSGTPEAPEGDKRDFVPGLDNLGEIFGSIDPGMLSQLGKLMGGGADNSNAASLVKALKPFLSPKRRDKLEKAMQIAKMAHLAEIALEAGGGETHV